MKARFATLLGTLLSLLCLLALTGFDNSPRPGQVLDEASDSAPRIARATYNAKDAGAYYIRVGADRTESTGTYSIVVIER